VRLGDLNLDPNAVDGAEPIDVAISRVIIHTRYNTPQLTNDVALLKLGNSVGFNRKYFLYLLIMVYYIITIIHYLTLYSIYKSLGKSSLNVYISIFLTS